MNAAIKKITTGVAVKANTTKNKFPLSVYFVNKNTINKAKTLPETSNKSFTAYFCIATNIIPIFFTTNISNVKAEATSIVSRNNSLLTKDVLKTLFKSTK